MTKLNLTAKGREQELILAYLQENASETLAEKINSGVIIEKDGQRVRNVKTLDGFMQFAADEAQKLAEKGARSACINDATVYGWAVHYFEEGSIEGTLYNEDGTPYRPTPARKETAVSAYKPPIAKPKPQMNIFDDLLGSNAQETAVHEAEDSEPTRERPAAETAAPKPAKPISPFYQYYSKFAAEHSDCLLLMRVGDFYEALDAHAEKIADVLGLTLTSRDCGLSERIPMCGIPYHAVELYAGKLIERGYKVRITDDLEDDHFSDEADFRVDPETGEVLHNVQPDAPSVDEQDGDLLDDFDTSAFDAEALCILSDLFGEEISVR